MRSFMNDEEYYNFVRPYADAMQMLLTRLDVLNHNLYGKSDSRPIHYIQNRIKKKKSLEEKLIRRGKEPTVDNAKDYLQDIAGVRIICYFVDDIYNLAKSLKRQADLIVIREQDYIKAPKPNGYRSYHNDTATTEIYTLSLHDALPIWDGIFSGRSTAADIIDGFLGKYGTPHFL